MIIDVVWKDNSSYEHRNVLSYKKENYTMILTDGTGNISFINMLETKQIQVWKADE